MDNRTDFLLYFDLEELKEDRLPLYFLQKGDCFQIIGNNKDDYSDDFVVQSFKKKQSIVVITKKEDSLKFALKIDESVTEILSAIMTVKVSSDLFRKRVEQIKEEVRYYNMLKEIIEDDNYCEIDNFEVSLNYIALKFECYLFIKKSKDSMQLFINKPEEVGDPLIFSFKKELTSKEKKVIEKTLSYFVKEYSIKDYFDETITLNNGFKCRVEFLTENNNDYWAFKLENKPF